MTSEELEQLIIPLRERGLTQAAIADELRVCSSTVQRAVSRMIRRGEISRDRAYAAATRLPVGKYNALVDRGVPHDRAVARLGLTAQEGILVRNLATEPNDRPHLRSGVPKFANHEAHVERCMAQGGFPALTEECIGTNAQGHRKMVCRLPLQWAA